MVISEQSNRILIASWNPNGSLQITAITPDEDPLKVKVKVMGLSHEDCHKLSEFIIEREQQQKRLDIDTSAPQHTSSTWQKAPNQTHGNYILNTKD
jgi:hypothetical protein